MSGKARLSKVRIDFMILPSLPMIWPITSLGALMSIIKSWFSSRVVISILSESVTMALIMYSTALLISVIFYLVAATAFFFRGYLSGLRSLSTPSVN